MRVQAGLVDVHVFERGGMVVVPLLFRDLLAGEITAERTGRSSSNTREDCLFEFFEIVHVCGESVRI